MTIRRLALLALLASLALCSRAALAAGADTPEAGAPSVHLRYAAQDATLFYNELTVLQSAPGSYFAVAGWHNGYFGLQELGNGRKQLIFSVWDSQDDKPARASAQQRVAVEFRDPAVRVGRFANEGTGGQARLPYDWQPGVRYAFLVKAGQSGPQGERASYSAYFRAPDMTAWRHLVTFSTPLAPTPLRGLYAFIEDFERTPASARQVRQALFSSGWVRTAQGGAALQTSRFTSYPPAALAVDAQAREHGFVLTTGGDTRTTGAGLGAQLEYTAADAAVPPQLP